MGTDCWFHLYDSKFNFTVLLFTNTPVLITFCLSSLLLGYIALLISQLLPQAGDVESNPGRDKDMAKYCDVSICHINIRSLNQTINKILYKLQIIKHEIAPKYN